MNKVYTQIIPEKPAILGDRRLVVYAPKVAYNSAGIMTFAPSQFNITGGEVSINRTFIRKANWVVSIAEPTNSAIQTWLKVLYYYLSLGSGVRANQIVITTRAEGFAISGSTIDEEGEMHANSSVTVPIVFSDNSVGREATVFLNGSSTDSFIVTALAKLGIRQLNRESSIVRAISITDNASGIGQLNQQVSVVRAITITDNAAGIRQLNRQSGVVRAITISDTAAGIKQINYQDGVVDPILFTITNTGIEQKSGAFSVVDNITFSYKPPTRQVQLAEAISLTDYIIIENTATGIPQINLEESSLTDYITIEINASGVTQLFHIAATLPANLQISCNAEGIAQLSNADMLLTNISITATASGNAQLSYDHSVIDAILLNIEVLGAAQSNLDSAGETSISITNSAEGAGNVLYYTVRFYGRNSSPPDQPLVTRLVYQYGTAEPPTPPPILPGYTFLLWDGEYTNVTTNRNIFAVYTTNYYSVTFLNWDDSHVYTVTNLLYGESAVAPIVTRTGWTFSHWTNSYQYITDNVITKAVFNINLYTVTWLDYRNIPVRVDTNVQYGSILTAPTGTTDTLVYDYEWPTYSYTVVANLTITETVTTKHYLVRWVFYSGSYIERWVIAGTTDLAPTGTTNTSQYTYEWPVSSIVNVTENAVIYETRTIRLYTVTWLDYRNIPVRVDTNIPYGSILTAPTGTTNTSQYTYEWPTYSYTVLESLTITETVTANYLIVFFDANGGSVSPSSKNVTLDSQYGTLPEPTRTNFTFVGWYTSASGGTWVSSSTLVTTTSNHTIYARWVGYDWVPGGTEPYGINECSSDFNLGNVRCDISTVCVWTIINIYFTNDDETSPKPTCFEGSIKTVCEENTPGNWTCTVSEGSIETTYTNCETCSMV